ncbi:MAG: FHA domain-containing protein, partial [Myxococcales bacterium]|nr:FHA domain-containing protein [Myxococcales bacterium]
MIALDNPTHTVKSMGVGASDLPRTVPALVLIVESHRPLAGGEILSLHGLDTLTLGRGGERRLERGPAARLQIPDPKMSSRHALLERTGKIWRLRDLGATNGCQVNGESVQETTLGDGDIVRLGASFFVFRGRTVEPQLLAASPALPGVHTLVGAHHMQLAR